MNTEAQNASASTSSDMDSVRAQYSRAQYSTKRPPFSGCRMAEADIIFLPTAESMENTGSFCMAKPAAHSSLSLNSFCGTPSMRQSSFLPRRVKRMNSTASTVPSTMQINFTISISSLPTAIIFWPQIYAPTNIARPTVTTATPVGEARFCANVAFVLRISATISTGATMITFSSVSFAWILA